jgi:hypothetical protein
MKAMHGVMLAMGALFLAGLPPWLTVHADEVRQMPGSQVAGNSLPHQMEQLGGKTGSGEQVRRTWYVWYRRSGGRWHGVGPYTYEEALRVQDDYSRAGYDAYVGGRNG